MSTECSLIHTLASALPRHRFPFQDGSIPPNGIYLLFEEGEPGHGGDRIVRIGAHRGQNQLRPRLYQHFLNANKDRSIFRKNVGRAILNHTDQPFLNIWNLDRTPKIARQVNLSPQQLQYHQEIESDVSHRIQKTFSFVVLEVNNDRLDIERGLIATISQCNECGPSARWFGNHSPLSKIVNSGLWQVQGLNGPSLLTEQIQLIFN